MKMKNFPRVYKICKFLCLDSRIVGKLVYIIKNGKKLNIMVQLQKNKLDLEKRMQL